MKKEYSIWISIVSLLLSVIAVCVAVWRSPELDFDYQGVLVGVLSLLVTVLVGLKDPLGLEYRYLYHSLISLSKVSQLDDTKTCNEIVKGLLEVIVRPENISMKKINKDRLYRLIYLVKNPDNIEGFGELMERIARIKAV